MQIKINSLSKRFANKNVLDDVSLTANSDDIICIVGANGSGKSTLIKILATLYNPNSGSVFLDNINVIDNPNQFRKVLGYLPQDVPIYPHLTATEFLNYISAIKGLSAKQANEQINKWLELFNLEQYKKQQLFSYSGGMRRRIGIVCALLGNPKIILLDEPNSGLDLEERINLRNILKEISKDRIILMATHITSDINAIGSCLVILSDGKINFKGIPSELIARTNTLTLEEAYLNFTAVDGNQVIF